MGYLVMTLSKEEKERIWEEERERLKARKKLEEPGCLRQMFGVVVLGLTILVLVAVFSLDDQKEESAGCSPTSG